MDEDIEETNVRKNSVKRHKPINRKTKLSIVFDEKARKEFLTGFRRRKLERKRKAQEQLKEWLKEEKKRIKKEAREEIKKLVLTNRPIPELEHLHEEEYDLPDHTVSVVELNPVDLESKNNWIGSNRVQYETDKEDESEKEDDEKEKESSELLGMELKSEKDVRKAIKHKATKQVQKSKAFQTKQRLEKKKQIKKSHKNKHQRVKTRMKKEKFKGHKKR
ncbi:nucleolar protein 12-like [Macrosteles quadrilineatus]|uniref:nucleolar protein 12-like n=1 Tax=Macrosteles quadrilineatus TaxID=74068 RepID=UPI0023E2E6A1|nr:nucleolar protein 12-like [Macrosteles quadrilineatus]XP_054289775.1 nucleolar protein 12-like [Macrosteles quadrilineatus]